MKEDFAVYQLLIFAISIFFILQAILKLVKKSKTPREVIFLVIFWASFSILAFSPHMIQKFGSFLGFEVGANAILTISVAALIIIIIKLTLRMDKAEANLTKLVRAIALSQLPKDKEDI